MYRAIGLEFKKRYTMTKTTRHRQSLMLKISARFSFEKRHSRPSMRQSTQSKTDPRPKMVEPISS
jgi:hypothetical protein